MKYFKDTGIFIFLRLMVPGAGLKKLKPET